MFRDLFHNPAPATSRTGFRIPARIWGRVGARFCLWQDRYRQRRALIALSDRALHDIGVGRSEAWSEYAKPFWRS